MMTYQFNSSKWKHLPALMVFKSSRQTRASMEKDLKDDDFDDLVE